MQHRLDEWQIYDTQLFIKISSGNGPWSWVTVQDDVFECDLTMCRHKQERFSCEHVQFAKQNYPAIVGAIAKKRTAKQLQDEMDAQAKAKAALADQQNKALAAAAILAAQNQLAGTPVQEQEQELAKPDLGFDWQRKRRIRVLD